MNKTQLQEQLLVCYAFMIFNIAGEYGEDKVEHEIRVFEKATGFDYHNFVTNQLKKGEING